MPWSYIHSPVNQTQTSAWAIVAVWSEVWPQEWPRPQVGSLLQGGPVPRNRLLLREGKVSRGEPAPQEKSPAPELWLPVPTTPQLSRIFLSLSCLRCSLLLIYLLLFASLLSGWGKRTELLPTRQWRMYYIPWLCNNGINKRTVICGVGLGL